MLCSAGGDGEGGDGGVCGTDASWLSGVSVLSAMSDLIDESGHLLLVGSEPSSTASGDDGGNEDGTGEGGEHSLDAAFHMRHSTGGYHCIRTQSVVTAHAALH